MTSYILVTYTHTNVHMYVQQVLSWLVISSSWPQISPDCSSSTQQEFHLLSQTLHNPSNNEPVKMFVKAVFFNKGECRDVINQCFERSFHSKYLKHCQFFNPDPYYANIRRGKTDIYLLWKCGMIRLKVLMLSK